MVHPLLDRGPRVGPLGGPGNGFEDKELRAVLCQCSVSFHSEECNPCLASLQSILPSLLFEDMSPHAGVAITISPDMLLTQKPVCSMPFSPFSSKMQGGGGRKERQPLCQKWQCLFKVTSYSHAAESMPVNHA